MSSLASILYSSTSAGAKKRRDRSLKTNKLFSNSTKCKTSGTLFRSSTPKTLLATKARPTVSAGQIINESKESSESPRCSTPVFSKQRRTRPFIACELCRQRAFDSLTNDDKKIEKPHLHHSHIRSTTLFPPPNQSTLKSSRRRSSIAQLLVWIV